VELAKKLAEVLTIEQIAAMLGHSNRKNTKGHVHKRLQGGGCGRLGPNGMVATQQVQRIPFLPQSHSHQGEEPAEAAIPFRKKSRIRQQKINQQARRYLPAHGVDAKSGW